MAVRVISGRAGSGKTSACIDAVARQLEQSLVEGSALVLLVPEQAALQTERRVLARVGSFATALGRCEVLSFRRLARRILGEARGPLPVPLTQRGRQMALRYLIGSHAGELREFQKIAERPGFIAELSRSLAELFQEGIGLDQLQQVVERAAADDDAVAARLHDLAFVYRAYLEYLGDDRVDPEGVLDLARARLANTTWLRGGMIWVDGFASLAGQQLRMVAELARIAERVEIALLMDPPVGAMPPSNEGGLPSLFSRTETTYSRLVRTLIDEGITVEPPHTLTASPAPRFRDASLALLETRLFRGPAGGSGSAIRPAPPGASKSMAPVRLVRARDRRLEVEAAVRHVRELTHLEEDPLRYRDIAILVRDLEPYHDLIAAEFTRHGIPCFIDRRQPTHHHPLVQLVRSLLSLHGGTSFQASMAAMLKTGLAGVSDEEADLLENYALARNLRWPAQWERRWTRSPRRDEHGSRMSPAARAVLDRLNRARERITTAIGDWWPRRESRDESHAAKDWAARLYDALDGLRVKAMLEAWAERADAAGRLDEAAEHEQVWNEFLSLLDELAEGLSDLMLTARQFREVLEAGLSEFTLGLVPATLDQVLVGSVERSRQPDLRAAFVLGFSDGHFPLRPGEGTIFTDAERRQFEANDLPLGRSRAQQILDERMLAYVALTRASELLWVSYPASDEQGRELLPSPYWQNILDALPGVTVEEDGPADASDAWTAAGLAAGMVSRLRSCALTDDGQLVSVETATLYEWTRTAAPTSVREMVSRALESLRPRATAKLDSRVAAELWPSPFETSVTRLESYAQCAYQHFISHGLRLSPRETPQIEPRHLGNFYHDLLEKFVEQLRTEQTSLAALSVEGIGRRLDAIMDRLFPEYVERLDLDEADARRMRWRGRNELFVAICAQKATIARAKLLPHLLEKRFGYSGEDDLPALRIRTPAGREVSLRGKIDRIDLLNTAEGPLGIVYDYKRSKKRSLNLARAFHGLEQQLLAYLLVLREATHEGRPIIPGGAFYLPLLAPVTRLEHPDDVNEEKQKLFDDFRPRGIVDITRIDDIIDAEGASIFNAVRTQSNSIARFEISAAVEHEQFDAVLAHVRARLGELADRWINGDIAIEPARYRNEIPCTSCSYRATCLFEYALNRTRDLESLKRSEVVDRVCDTGGQA